VYEIFMALLEARTLVLAPREGLRRDRSCAACLREERVTTTLLTPPC
jgi:non-ribosomal peptide synthetase component F